MAECNSIVGTLISKFSWVSASFCGYWVVVSTDHLHNSLKQLEPANKTTVTVCVREKEREREREKEREGERECVCVSEREKESYFEL